MLRVLTVTVAVGQRAGGQLHQWNSQKSLQIPLYEEFCQLEEEFHIELCPSLVLVEEVEELLLVLPDGQLDPLPEELEVPRREGQRRVRVHLKYFKPNFWNRMWSKMCVSNGRVGQQKPMSLIATPA